MTAVGVAKPRAHGHAIQSTEMAQRKANWTVISVLEYKSLAYNNSFYSLCDNKKRKGN